jgi:hypothetical protein
MKIVLEMEELNAAVKQYVHNKYRRKNTGTIKWRTTAEGLETLHVILDTEPLRDNPDCPYPGHAPDCNCKGMGGDR